MSSLTLIVAATVSNGIGQSSRLPWRLPLEMAYFARVTSDAPEGCRNAVIMGRNTWESIPQKFRPLRNRVNIVISHNETYDLKLPESTKSVAPTYLHSNLKSALSKLPELSLHRQFIIGGAALYAETLALSRSSLRTEQYPLVDRIMLTRILSPAFEDCDVFLPEFRQEVVSGKVGVNVETAWIKASHDELQTWVGFEVPWGVQEERGIKYEFQMWVRITSRSIQ